MFRFAHFSDVHLGAFRDPVLRELEKQAFADTVSSCLELKVDFVLISGDLFHVSIPDLSVVNDSIRILRQLQANQIPVYMIYGSHDYTPNGVSIIDILDTAGIITNVMRPHADEEGMMVLQLLEDPKTKAKLTGVSARRVGLESKFYEKLDRARLEREKGFKIFVFHTGIREIKASSPNDTDSVPISYFPKGFDYYAGGHVHERGEYQYAGYAKVVYPGPLFTGYGRDLEETARGVKRGFYLVEFEQRIEKIEFVPMKSFEGAFLEYDANGKNSQKARKELEERLNSLEVNGKLVVARIKGELSGGKTTDIDFVELRRQLLTRGALYVHFNRFSLSSQEYSASRHVGEDPTIIERRLFNDNIGALKVNQGNLKGERGVSTSLDLLRIARQPQKTGEAKADYASRITRAGIEALELQQEFNNNEEKKTA